ncbi:nuclear transport factor 2 family protein [Streptomyces mirabilis]|uniref:nuclear transport factor 2 family protein n=1 Tax=Streptomyces mirabilis TaxID=68239 RepID=UPI0036577C93
MNITDIAINWIEKLNQPDSTAFSNLFAENGMYVDPSYGLARRGRELVHLHHHQWHAAVPDFKAEVERVLVDGSTATILYAGTGTFDGEPLGPGGGKSVQPTNRPFKARVVIVLDIDENGLVACCTEYYDRSIMPLGEETPYSDDPFAQE